MATAEEGVRAHGWSTRYSYNALVSEAATQHTSASDDDGRALLLQTTSERLQAMEPDNIILSRRVDYRLMHAAICAIIKDQDIIPDTRTGILKDLGSVSFSAQYLLDCWSAAQRRTDTSTEAAQEAQNPGHGRSAADKRAQRLVAEAWNGGRCLLSGMPLAEGAHIIPVRTLSQASAPFIYQALGSFWALPELGPDDLVLAGREVTNILPLAATVHQSFDRYQFALLPMPQAKEGQAHRLPVKIVFLDKDAEDAEGRRLPRAGFFTDTRRGHENAETGLYESPHVRNGDVFEITTSDPAICPLPDVRLLQIQYAVHVMMAGIRAVGALTAIFQEDPPSSSGPTYDVAVPDIWKDLLESATEQNVLTHEEAASWERFLICETIKRAICFDVELPGLPAEGRQAWIETLEDENA